MSENELPPGSIVLRVTAGPALGEHRLIPAGGGLVVGRGPGADLVVTDPLVSGSHFAIESEGGRFFVRDLGSTNGTVLGGVPVEREPLAPGDVIAAGDSGFAVEFASSSLAEAEEMKVRWRFPETPDGWEVVPGVGLKRTQERESPPNVVVLEDTLAPEDSLAAYVEAQLALMKEQLRDFAFEYVDAALPGEVDDALALEIRHRGDGDRTLVQRQTYARRGDYLAVATCTALDSDFADAAPVFEWLASALVLDLEAGLSPEEG